MNFTPPLPTDNNGNIPSELILLAEKVCIESAKMTASYSPAVLDSIKELLRKVNSYYSNKIESEGTHPIDIDRAMNMDFDQDKHKRDLQELSLVYIDVQKEIESMADSSPQNPFSREFILDLHYKLYSKSTMKSFLEIEHQGESIAMIAGKFRERNVIVGRHVAPNFQEIDSLFNQYESFYKIYPYFTQAKKLIYAIVSHHKLTWIHPFLDGNGRTSRLVLDGILLHIHLEGYGLWNISRGLAKDSRGYREYLAQADMVRQGDRDGRGALSSKGLQRFVKFMLETSLDQIKFMNECLRLDLLSSRIEKFVRLSQEGMYGRDILPKYSELLLKELLIKGEIARGEVKYIIGTKDRTASTLIKKLIEMDYIESSTPKRPIRLKFNSFFASKVFPELMG